MAQLVKSARLASSSRTPWVVFCHAQQMSSKTSPISPTSSARNVKEIVRSVQKKHASSANQDHFWTLSPSSVKSNVLKGTTRTKSSTSVWNHVWKLILVLSVPHSALRAMCLLKTLVWAASQDMLLTPSCKPALSQANRVYKESF